MDMAKIGVVGHRYFSHNRIVDFVSQQCVGLLTHYKKSDPNLSTISAIAEGADTIFADAAIKLNLPLDIVRPFRNYAEDFQTIPAKENYHRIREVARFERILSFETRSDDAYEAAMKWIVMESDLLIAVWDGLPSGGRGGTGHAVQYAVQLNLPWIHLSTTEQAVMNYT